MKMPVKKLYIARPAGILPVHKPKYLSLILRTQYVLVTIFKYITPSYVITSVELSKALLYIVKKNETGQLYNQQQLKQIAKQLT
jgi:hypothetical protein